MENKIMNTIINPGHSQIPGADRFDDGELSFGPEYAAYREKWNEYPKKRIVDDFPLNVDKL